MKDDERPNPREEQNKRETKKHKSHKRLPICDSITRVRSFRLSREAVFRGCTSHITAAIHAAPAPCTTTFEYGPILNTAVAAARIISPAGSSASEGNRHGAFPGI